MIDDKKIKEESYRLIDGISQNDKVMRAVFTVAAKWAQEEFLKDLVHPNTEKPKAGKKILVYTIDGYETITYIGEGEIDCGINWMDIVSDMAIGSWCYPEDLFPKKGVKQ